MDTNVHNYLLFFFFSIDLIMYSQIILKREVTVVILSSFCSSTCGLLAKYK